MTAARVHVEITDRDMVATLRVEPGDPLDAAEFRHLLTSAGVSFGIDVAVMGELAARVSDPSYACERLLIARGRPMERASAESLELVVSLGLRAGHANADGTFDYRDRGLFTPVLRGTTLARCHHAQPGAAGRTVRDGDLAIERITGAPIPTFGPGVSRLDSGEVVAARDGVAIYAPGVLLDVTDQHTHKGDVDLRSGNLDMQGTLTITGEVTPHFDVRTTGDVEIKKGVRGGSVFGGINVVIHGGVVGTGGGCVLAEGDVTASHAEGATIHCGGTLTLTKGAVSCDLHAAYVHIPGAVRGGRVAAEHAIVVRDAGSRAGSETEFVVGAHLDRPLRTEFDAHCAEQHQARRLAAQVVRVRTHQHRRRGEAGHTDGSAHEHPVSDLLHGAHVDVVGAVYPGTVIVIGPHRLVVSAPHGPSRFSLDPETLEIRRDPL